MPEKLTFADRHAHEIRDHLEDFADDDGDSSYYSTSDQSDDSDLDDATIDSQEPLDLQHGYQVPSIAGTGLVPPNDDPHPSDEVTPADENTAEEQPHQCQVPDDDSNDMEDQLPHPPSKDFSDISDTGADHGSVKTEPQPNDDGQYDVPKLMSRRNTGVGQAQLPARNTGVDETGGNTGVAETGGNTGVDNHPNDPFELSESEPSKSADDGETSSDDDDRTTESQEFQHTEQVGREEARQGQSRRMRQTTRSNHPLGNLNTTDSPPFDDFHPSYTFVMTEDPEVENDPDFALAEQFVHSGDPEVMYRNLSHDDARELLTFVTEQMSAKAGLKLFGEGGADAIKKELEQLVYRGVMEGQLASTLSTDQKQRALTYLMFLKEKRCGKIKARGCADGRKQRIYKTKEETSSPTVSIDALFATCLVDAAEGRDVVTCDIPSAFMQADINEEVFLWLDGEIALLLIKVDPTYARFLTYENGWPVIYALLKRRYMGRYKRLYCFGRTYLCFLLTSRDSRSTRTIFVWPIRTSTVNNAPSLGTWMI
jgi:hypothetical protein